MPRCNSPVCNKRWRIVKILLTFSNPCVPYSKTNNLIFFKCKFSKMISKWIPTTLLWWQISLFGFHCNYEYFGNSTTFSKFLQPFKIPKTCAKFLQLFLEVWMIGVDGYNLYYFLLMKYWNPRYKVFLQLFLLKFLQLFTSYNFTT